MKRIVRSARLFVQGLRIFYSCDASWWLLLLATPTILLLCVAVALLNLSDDENVDAESNPGGQP